MKRGLYGLLLFIIFLVLGCGSSGKSSSFNQSSNNPYFLSDNNVSVPLNKLKSFRFKVVAKDATNVKYYITGEEARTFFIDALTGELSFQNPNDINTLSVYTFTVIAEDEVGHRELQELMIHIIENESISGNQPPLVNAGKDRSTRINQGITLEGSASDSDGEIIAYEWTKENKILATTLTFEYLPTVIGTDKLRLRVTDNDGATNSDSILITVNELASSLVSKWLTPTQNICVANRGSFSLNSCQASWEDAKTICSVSGGETPSIEQLRIFVTDCGAVLNESDNTKNESYGSCYQEKGFGSHVYWSSSIVVSENASARFMNVYDGVDGWGNKTDDYHVRCLKVDK